MSWVCLEVAHVAVICGAFSLVLDVWKHYLTDYALRMNSEPHSLPQAVRDLVFACVCLFLDPGHLINCVALPGKLCSNPFKFHVSWKVCRRQVPAFPQPPQPPCNIAAMQAEVGIVQSRSLERSHNVQKLESVQVQVEAPLERHWHVCLTSHIDTHCI